MNGRRVEELVARADNPAMFSPDELAVARGEISHELSDAKVQAAKVIMLDLQKRLNGAVADLRAVRRKERKYAAYVNALDEASQQFLSDGDLALLNKAVSKAQEALLA